MSKPSRGNLFFLLTFIYSIIFPYILSTIFSISPSFYDFFYNLPTPLSIIFSQLIVFFLPIVIYFFVTKEPVKEVIPIKSISSKNIFYIVAISFLIQPIMTFLGLIGGSIESNKIFDTVYDLLNYNFLYALLAMAIIPAFIEEIFMRGVIFSNYKNVPIFESALINGIFFGMLHRNMQQLFYATLLGFIFTYFIYYTKSIFSVILGHFIINATQVIYIFLLNIIFNYLGLNLLDEVTKEATESIGLGAYILSFVFMIPFIFIVLFLMKKFIKNNKPNTELVDTIQCEPYLEKNFYIIVGIFIIYTILSVLGIVQ